MSPLEPRANSELGKAWAGRLHPAIPIPLPATSAAQASRLRVAFLGPEGEFLVGVELRSTFGPLTPGERRRIVRRAASLRARSVVLIRSDLEPPFEVSLGDLAALVGLRKSLRRQGGAYLSLILLGAQGDFLHLHLSHDAVLWAPGYAGRWDLDPGLEEPA